MRLCWVVFLAFTLRSSCALEYTAFDDASWAINTQNVSDMLPGRREFYEKFMEGCVNTSGYEPCQQNEYHRLQMNMYQPRSMYNYTKTGFRKARCPENVFKLIKAFWERNRDQAVSEWDLEEKVTVYHNAWEIPTEMVRVNNASLPGGGKVLQAAIANAARDFLEEWTGMRQAAASVYGIRIYREGSVLAPHVDRLPLVSSVIVNVDQDVDEDWPLEVYDHDGVAHNVTMEPGDIVYYESHSILHGRPFPLKGRFYGNIFLHFEPVGPVNLEERIDNADLPPYMIPYSSWEPEWRLTNPDGWTILKDPWSLASQGDDRTLWYISQTDPSVIHWADDNGWTPIFNAARAGQLHVVKLLTEQGVNVNHVSQPGDSLLKVADYYQGAESEMSEYLRSVGAVMDPPEEARIEMNPWLFAENDDVDSLQLLSKMNPSSLQWEDENGWTPLMYASKWNSMNAVRYLVQKGVEVNVRARKGRAETAMGIANRHLGEGNPISQFLQSKGGLVNPPPVDEIERARLMNPWTLASHGTLDALESLAKLDPSQLHKADQNGWTPLFFAARKGNLEIVQYLVEQGVDINAQSTNSKETALVVADRYFGEGNPVSRYLISKGGLYEPLGVESTARHTTMTSEL